MPDYSFHLDDMSDKEKERQFILVDGVRRYINELHITNIVSDGCQVSIESMNKEQLNVVFEIQDLTDKMRETPKNERLKHNGISLDEISAKDTVTKLADNLQLLLKSKTDLVWRNQKAANEEEDNKMEKEGDTRSNKKVIIVGNSPSVLEKEYGQLIDSFDIVIRLNRCVIDGYEKYIGRKINIWATTGTTQHYKGWVPDNFFNLDELWTRTIMSGNPQNLKLPEPTDAYDIKKYKNLIKKVMWNKHLEKGGPRYFVKYMNRFKAKNHDNHELCTGLLTILTAIKYFKDITVHGFTFYTEQKDGMVSGYYREKELNDKGVHNEDGVWSKNKKTGFASKKQGNYRQAILTDLIQNGLPIIDGKKIGHDFLFHSEPVKILNHEELTNMEL